ncbi:MAG TPA: hypothetical protein VF137_12515 [Candidatus Dormibacteraeota bacterium]
MSEQQVAWTAMPYRAPVIGSENDEIGTAESLMGDEADDIFHGIAVKLKHGRMVELAADRVQRITTERVYTDVGHSELDSLPDYKEERWFHLGWGGLFRKHPKWERE